MGLLVFLKQFNRLAVVSGLVAGLAYASFASSSVGLALGQNVLIFRGIHCVSVFAAMVLLVYASVAIVYVVLFAVKALSSKRERPLA